MLSITTSPPAIRLTDSVNVAQKARKKPAFFMSISSLVRLSISPLVMLPMFPNFSLPDAWAASAASIGPICGSLISATLPLYCGLNSSAQLSTCGITVLS